MQRRRIINHAVSLILDGEEISQPYPNEQINKVIYSIRSLSNREKMSRPNIQKMISDLRVLHTDTSVLKMKNVMLKTKYQDLKETNVQLKEAFKILQKKFEKLKIQKEQIESEKNELESEFEELQEEHALLVDENEALQMENQKLSQDLEIKCAQVKTEVRVKEEVNAMPSAQSTTPVVSVGLPMPIISNENQRPKARVINFSLTINSLLISPHDNILLYNLYDNPYNSQSKTPNINAIRSETGEKSANLDEFHCCWTRYDRCQRRTL